VVYVRRGIYSATITLAALAIAIAVIANAGQVAAFEEANAHAEAAMQVKRHWQNSSFVLGKAASDAIADSILNEGCMYAEASANNRVNDYFTSVLGEMWGGECSLASVGLSGPAGDIQISVVTTCTKQLGEGFKVSYEKQMVFKKSVEIFATSPCSFVVTDLHSGTVEASYPF
jgi:hypothetical protein